jgi:hypothetical protein
MTAVEAEERTGSATSPEHVSRGLVLFLLAAVLAAGVFWSWVAEAADLRSDVAVAWSRPVTCTGTGVVGRTLELGEPDRVRAIRLRRSMDCHLPVRVTNNGRRSVRIDKLRLPFMGPDGGAAVQVEELQGRRPLPGRVDGIFPMERSLEPGGSHDFVIDFSFRAPPKGCTAEGVMWMHNFPHVTVTALGRSGTRSSDKTIAFVGTRMSSC